MITTVFGVPLVIDPAVHDGEVTLVTYGGRRTYRAPLPAKLEALYGLSIDAVRLGPDTEIHVSRAGELAIRDILPR